MRTDRRRFITVAFGMDTHPKIEGLSDKAFRLLITTWLYCAEHGTDGVVKAARWNKSATPKARRELIENGLVSIAKDHFVMHDFLKHQSSKSDQNQISDDRSKAAIAGNHKRWHEARNAIDDECPHCDETYRKGIASAIASVIANASQTDRKPIAEVEVEKEQEIHGSSMGASYVSSAPAPRGPGSSAAFHLVLKTIGHDITSTTRTALAFEVQRLMPEADEPTIVDALQRWNSRSGVGPKMLPGLVDDIRKEARGATTHAPPALVRPSTTDQRVAAAQALKAQFATNGANVLQLPSGDHR